jgi:AmmeMemoRadiSam system protein B/AmmeMemoRadiSam system protein A
MSISTLFTPNANGEAGGEGPISVRPAAVAGSFYPADKNAILSMMKEFFKEASDIRPSSDVAAIIVPHAGYVFSGAVAATAFAQIDPTKKYEHIFLIGPSHHVYMDSASVNNEYDYYATPLGRVKVDTELCDRLIHDHRCFVCNPKAHDKEHCLEVQLPFLQYHLQQMPPIVPIIVASQSLSVIRDVAKALKPFFNSKNLFIISSDFSHYPSYEDAKTVDGLTGKAVESGKLDVFIAALAKNEQKNISNLATSACGQSAIATLLCLLEGNDDITIHHLRYRNSGDSSYGDHSQVVGYHAFSFLRKSKAEDFHLTDTEKSTLLSIARRSIRARLDGQNSKSYDSTELTPTLRMRCGAFVTLNEGGQLRGCIGHFGSDIPLYEVVEEMAQAAAFEDPRFYRLRADEFDKIDIEISVLSPMKKIKSIDEFELGRQGIYISKGAHGGTFLPQVADETHWTKEEFLGHCARDKAGLSWDGWKDADLYTYEAVVFKEEKR